MTSHAQCTHQDSPSSRRSCRMARSVVAVARKYGLAVEELNTHNLTPQYVIGTQRSKDWDTQILITVGWGTPRVSRREATGGWVDQTWGRNGLHVVAWLQMMRDDDERA